MCGLAAFIGKNYDFEMMLVLANLASKRGPDACGAASDSMGLVKRSKGGLRKNIDLVPNHARAIILHSRLATTGQHASIEQVQPFKIADETYFAHNGTYHKRAPSGSDSEQLGRDILNGAVNGLTASGVAFMLDVHNMHLLTMVQDMPMHRLEKDGGYYFCSVPFEGATKMENGNHGQTG